MRISSPSNPNNSVPPFMWKTMETVKKILEQTKNPQFAADVDHKFDDKYVLVEYMTNTAIAATLNVLDQLDGFNEEVLKKMISAVQDEKRTVTLRLTVEEKCDFLEETSRKVDSPTTQATVDSTSSDKDSKTTETSTTVSHKVVREVKEYRWKASYNHKLIIFMGTNDTEGIVLGGRAASTELITSMKKEPFRPQTRPPIDLDATFLFAQIEKNTLVTCFEIDREEAKTPRRNKQVEDAVVFIENLTFWSNRCMRYFRRSVRSELLAAYKDSCPGDWLSKISADDIFVPIAPLFQEESSTTTVTSDYPSEKRGLVSLKNPSSESPVLSIQDTTKFLQEQIRSLQTGLEHLITDYPNQADPNQFVSGYEAKVVLLFAHLINVAQHWRFAVDYVEDMLRNQLISAIGKEVDSQDFNKFLRFHNQRMFSKSYSPKPFCYAIRQPCHYPDGVLSIIANNDSNGYSPDLEGTKRNEDPVETFVRHIPGESLPTPISIPLNAATSAEFLGDQYLHGWMDTNFAGQSNQTHSISARAWQFSCFLLMVGTISGPEEFTPSDAIILQNKDEVLIPLLTNPLPSAKEFRDAIKSLSPEQARFAKAYRAMQLDSSVFGICIVQVKPQLEVLLQLPPGALTKEIKLTQELMSLFVDYQIPPTLVSYDDGETLTLSEKVDTVKQHVKRVLDVIESMKQSQLDEEKKQADARVEMERKFVEDAVPHLNPQGSAGVSQKAVVRRGTRPKLFSKVASQNTAHIAAPPKPSMAAATGEAAQEGSYANAQLPREGGFEREAFVLSETDDFETVEHGKSSERESDERRNDMDWLDTPSEQIDFTSIPKKLDNMFETYDKEGALRTVTLKTGDNWIRHRQENLLTKSKKSVLNSDDQKTETNKALDLLDALSRSGSLPIASGELHVLIGVRHLFEKNVMSTVIEENVNPIEKVDYSSLLIAATVHQVDIPTLLVNSADPPKLVLQDRTFPTLMIGATESNDEKTEE